jgi:rubrerythrin
MALIKPAADTPVEHHWVCEACDNVHVGVNPPDWCSYCEHTYFENLADMFRERDAAKVH